MNPFEGTDDDNEENKLLHKKSSLDIDDSKRSGVTETDIEDHQMKIKTIDEEEEEEKDLKKNGQFNNEYVYYSTVLTLVILILTGFVYFIYTKVHVSVLVTEKQMIKPLVDHNEYRVIKLVNGLEAMLISNPRQINCGASLTVKAGSFLDKDIPGLAHLTEHMVYLGSKTFPTPNHFLNYVSSYLGDTNAYTEDEYTTFYFNVGYQNLQQSLLMFSKMLSEPLFNEDSIRKETDIINSEFLNNVNTVSWIANHIARRFAKEDHPFSKFNVGNKEIFDQYETNVLQREVIDYFTKNFNGKNMKLVVSSNESLNVLQNIVISYFSEIREAPNANDQKILKEESTDAFPQENKGKIIWFEKGGDDPAIDFMFIIESIKPLTSTKPFDYIGYVLNSKHKGSLYDSLVNRGLINQMEVGVGKSYHSFATYVLSFTLGKEDGSQVEEIIAIVFAYLNHLQSVPINEEIYNEIKAIGEAYFMFKQEDKQLSDYLTELSYSMTDEFNPMSHVLVKDYSYEKYDEGIIQKFIGMLNQNNSLIFLSGNQMMNETNKIIKEKFFSNQAVDDVEKWYHRNFTHQSLNMSALNDFNASSMNFTMRQANKLITKQREVIGSQMLRKQSIPNLYKEKPQIRLWYQSDNSYSIPSIVTKIQIVSSTLLNKDSDDYFIFNLWANYLQRQANIELADFLLAKGGLNYEIKHNGLIIEVISYTDVTEAVIEKLVATIEKTATMTEEVFNNFVNVTINSFIDDSKEQLYEKTLKIFLKKLKPYYFKYDELTKFNMSYIDFLERFGKMTTGLAYQVLFYGNIDENAMKNLSIHFDSLIKDSSLITKPIFSKFNEQRNMSQLLIYQTKNSDPKQTEGITDNYFKYSSNDELSLYPYSILLESLWGNMFYTILRTEKMLGYVVFAHRQTIDNNVFLRFLIQGNKLSPNEMNVEIDKVIWRLKEKIDMLTRREFNDLKSNMLNQLKKKENNLAEVTNMVWKEILLETNDFTRKEKLIQSMEKTTLNGLIEELYRVFIDQPQKLSVQLYGSEFNLSTNTDEPYYLSIEKKYNMTTI